MNSRCVLRVEPIEFVGGFELGREETKRTKDRLRLLPWLPVVLFCEGGVTGAQGRKRFKDSDHYVKYF